MSFKLNGISGCQIKLHTRKIVCFPQGILVSQNESPFVPRARQIMVISAGNPTEKALTQFLRHHRWTFDIVVDHAASPKISLTASQGSARLSRRPKRRELGRSGLPSHSKHSRWENSAAKHSSSPSPPLRSSEPKSKTLLHTPQKPCVPNEFGKSRYLPPCLPVRTKSFDEASVPALLLPSNPAPQQRAHALSA